MHSVHTHTNYTYSVHNTHGYICTWLADPQHTQTRSKVEAALGCEEHVVSHGSFKLWCPLTNTSTPRTTQWVPQLVFAKVHYTAV